MAFSAGNNLVPPDSGFAWHCPCPASFFGFCWPSPLTLSSPLKPELPVALWSQCCVSALDQSCDKWDPHLAWSSQPHCSLTVLHDPPQLKPTKAALTLHPGEGLGELSVPRTTLVLSLTLSASSVYRKWFSKPVDLITLHLGKLVPFLNYFYIFLYAFNYCLTWPLPIMSIITYLLLENIIWFAWSPCSLGKKNTTKIA